MKNFALYFIAIFIVMYIKFYNRKLVKKKCAIEGYDTSQSLSLDAFAGRNYRALWNTTLITDDGYKFGVEGETMSSVLGKNILKKTLTNRPTEGMPRWFYGTNLIKILDKTFGEKDHCYNAINWGLGDFENNRY